MNKRRKLMIWLLVMSFWGAILGGYFKINDNPNADYILALAIIFLIAGISGLISKWSTYLTRSEAEVIKNRH
jgi:hypothetical protein